MEKLNNKKVILVIILALVVIAAIILGIIFLGNGGSEEGKKSGTISQTESEFEPLRVKDIELTYKDDGSETIIDFAIENTTGEKVEKQTINSWLQRTDSHRQPQGYEPCELPLLYPAMCGLSPALCRKTKKLPMMCM